MTSTRFRKPVHRLDADEEHILEGAFRVLAQSLDDTANYAFWASIHAHCCPHQTALFLPWHRAYIFQFEEALRRAAGAEITLPYWDWVAVPRVPPLVERLLPEAPRFSDAHREAHDLRLPTQEQIDRVLRKEAYKFIGASCAHANPGEFEKLHGRPHMWTGPYMEKKETAAFDPIFWLHHANVDRIWAFWQREHHGEHPPCPRRTLDGIPGGWKVSDVEYVSSPRLGYEYVDQVIEIAGPQAVVMSGDVSLTIPATRCRGARLLLNGIQLAGEGPAPSEIEARVNGGASCVSVALFGLGTGRHERGPRIVPVPGCEGGHEHHGGAFSTDIDLTGDGSPIQRIDLRLRGHARAAGLTIGQVVLICE